MVAKTLYNMYLDTYHLPMDEMKMHKLMYFSQRESLMETGNLMFDEEFYGWKYGPVLKKVRSEYRKRRPFEMVEGTVAEGNLGLLKAVFYRYADVDAWELSAMSHAEYSWKKSREGLSAGEDGKNKLDVKAMKVDAVTEKYRRLRYET